MDMRLSAEECQNRNCGGKSTNTDSAFPSRNIRRKEIWQKRKKTRPFRKWDSKKD